MTDAALRRAQRYGQDLRLHRAGLCSVLTWGGYGRGYGYGDGDGDGRGYGYGYGDGDGSGYGSGYGDGHGDGHGGGDGSGHGKEPEVRHEEYMQIGTPVTVRSHTSGVFVGRLAGGEAGSVALTDWRWLRYWEGVGGQGSVYDLVHSDKGPAQAGPLIETVTILQQADVMEISEEAYKRLAHGHAAAAS